MFKAGDRVRYKGAFGEGEGTIIHAGPPITVDADNGERAWLNAACLTLAEPPLKPYEFIRWRSMIGVVFQVEGREARVAFGSSTVVPAGECERITQAEAQEAV